MSEPFIGEIRLVGFNFAPRGWALCDGQILPIAQNTALFSLLGTAYGGDGRSTFALPDLRGRIAKHVGSGPGLNTVSWGQRGGVETHTLSVNEMPNHTHQLHAENRAADSSLPRDRMLARSGQDSIYSEVVAADDIPMAAQSIGATGGGSSFDIRNPYLGIYHVIALVGLFPSRN